MSLPDGTMPDSISAFLLSDDDDYMKFPASANLF